VVGQQPNRPALLRMRGVGAQLVGPSHGQPLSCREVRWSAPARRPYVRSEAMRIVNSDRGTIQRSCRRSRFHRQRKQAVPVGGN
jgi:hypothetical protein